MKRDWDLIRLLLLGIENHSVDQIQGYSQEQIEYHLYLLCNGGFVDPSTSLRVNTDRSRGVEGNSINNYQLNQRGIVLLKELRDEQKYRKAMEFIEERGGGATEEILVGVINDCHLKATQYNSKA